MPNSCPLSSMISKAHAARSLVRRSWRAPLTRLGWSTSSLSTSTTSSPETVICESATWRISAGVRSEAVSIQRASTWLPSASSTSFCESASSPIQSSKDFVALLLDRPIPLGQIRQDGRIDRRIDSQIVVERVHAIALKSTVDQLCFVSFRSTTSASSKSSRVSMSMPRSQGISQPERVGM